jgi:thiol-disulfide isomerase/thioredoxin
MRPYRSSILWTTAFFVVTVAAVCVVVGRGLIPSRLPESSAGDSRANTFIKPVSFNQGGAPSLRGGVDWINSGPIALSELHGKIVLLDFWTFCCINCHHVLPDLAKLEEKYKNELVVIGVHTAKFPAERETENIRRKVREYRIKHPVINDANQTIWTRFNVNSWPTLVLIDAKGNYVDAVSGEGNYDVLDRTIGHLVEVHKARGELNLTPLKFNPEMERPSDGPLLFPGKVLADSTGKRIFIADTGHNRIIQANSDGSEPVKIGSGAEGFDDGESDKATFNRPQGMCLEGETLYVADTENHAIRAIDLKDHTVTTIAGTGSQARGIPRPGASGQAKTTQLCSPWDVIQLAGDKAIYIAMAGTHQIWKLDRGSEMVSVFAGSGVENIRDGNLATASFAQPSGLATDGENLFVADSEVSGVRVITGIRGRDPGVRTIVGQGLFEFGDKDGRGTTVRLQHCLGLAYADGHLYIADSYNNKIKICEPRNRSVRSLVGSHKPGFSDDPPHFYEPGGLSATENHLFVADTNNNKIRVVDLKTHAVKTLALEGLSAPKLAPRPPSFPNAKIIDVASAKASPGSSIAVAVSVALPKGYKLNEAVPLTYLVETPEKSGLLSSEVLPEGQKVKPPVPKFTINVPLAKPAAAGEKIDLRLSLQTFICSDSSNLCAIKSYVWNLPVEISDDGGTAPLALSTDSK